jgi:hypothetical protein
MEEIETEFIRPISSALGMIACLTLGACGSPTITPTMPAAPLATPKSTPALTTTSVVETSTAVPSASQTPTAILKPYQSGMPEFRHIYTIVMENKEYGSIVGSQAAPYLNSLIAQYGLATNYTGVAHPSEPNYFALFSGSTQGVTDDGVHNLNGQNLADQIGAAGRTWRVFAENVPLNCFTGAVAMNGEDGSGVYARKHEPAISFTDISRSSSHCANISDLTHFDPAAANYELVVPNLCHDMHDCSVAVGDHFLNGFVPTVLNSQAWQADGVLFIVWDEGTTNLGGGGHVPLLVISNRVQKGSRSAVTHNHYSLLRTVEDAWGLGCLNQACKANNLGEFFH